MKLIILLSVIYVILLCLLFIPAIRNNLYAVVLIPVFSSFVFLPIIATLIVDKCSVYENEINFSKKYEVTEIQIKAYNEDLDDGKLLLREILDDIDRINHQIEYNKKNVNNKLIGDLFSEQIANATPLKFENNKLNE